MNKYISAEVVKVYMFEAYPLLQREYLINAINGMPAADVQEVKHGRWEYNNEAYVGSNPYGSYNCSICGENVPHKTNYCPNCGARMDEVTE